MPSPEQKPPGLTAVSRWARRAALVGACLLALLVGGSRSGHAQPPPPVSEREAERQRLLEQLGLKKRAPVAPTGSADGEADREKKTEKETEKAKPDSDEAPRAGERPSADRGTTEAKPQAPAELVFSGAVHRALLGRCQSCHRPGGVAARSTFVLGGALDADFAATQRQLNAGQPEQSPLLRKASGAGHGGGAVLAVGAADYQLLSRWISDGAKRGAVAAPVAPPAAPDAVIPALGAPAVEARTTPPTLAASPPGDPSVPDTGSVTAVAGPEVVSVAARLDYAPTVHDALNQACAGCHRSGALAGNTGYVLSGEVAADFASTRRFVNLETPEASPLLRKASGAGHAGGAIYPLGSDAHLRLLQWIQFGALGPTEAAASAAPLASPASAPALAPRAPASALPDRATADSTAAAGNGLSLPWNFRLNGRFDLNYERRHFDTQPFSAGDDAIQSYHHFIFLSRQAQGDPVGFSAELINLTFWEVTYHLGLPESAGQLWIKAGKLLVPFGPDPLFHQSYGGLAGFDQRVLPVIWAQEGVSARFLLERGDASGSADLYAVRGHALKQRDAVLSLQSDLSPVDDAHVAIGARLRASWKAVSLFYSGYVNGLGFGRLLYLQAADVAVWRWRGVPVLEHLAAEVGLLRADVSGAGPGQDYYHFASYFRLRYFLTDSAYLQYRQGLRTFDNRRGVILDDTRLTREDGSTHGFGLVSRYGPLTLGLSYFLNLEKADEVKDDFLRVTGVYEF
jgi:hypothetical protein